MVTWVLKINETNHYKRVLSNKFFIKSYFQLLITTMFTDKIQAFNE